MNSLAELSNLPTMLTIPFPDIFQRFFLSLNFIFFSLGHLSYDLCLSGDMAASQVTALTEEVTAIVMNARPERGDRVRILH